MTSENIKMKGITIKQNIEALKYIEQEQIIGRIDAILFSTTK